MDPKWVFHLLNWIFMPNFDSEISQMILQWKNQYSLCNCQEQILGVSIFPFSFRSPVVGNSIYEMYAIWMHSMSQCWIQRLSPWFWSYLDKTWRKCACSMYLYGRWEKLSAPTILILCICLWFRVLFYFILFYLFNYDESESTTCTFETLSCLAD